MKIQQALDLSTKELTYGLVLFVLFFLITFVSRTTRINQSDAIIGVGNSDLHIENDIYIDELISILDSAEIDFDEQELRWASRLLGWRKFRKGHYTLNGEFGYNELLTKLAFGSQDPVLITILPGITLERFSRNLGLEMNFDSTDVAKVFDDSLFTRSKKLSKEQMFGRMLPDTYSIYWTSSAENTIEKILDEFDSKIINTYNERIDSLEYSVDEIIAMASIVEWEANIEDEKSIVAGLYWNRIDRRMYLQADPTISFAVGERRRLLLEDYKVDHPYNTYTKFGLPPGPVTNPSLKTIEATLYPDNHNYLYMVASPEGGHIFNRTYEEHLVDAEKWRKWLRQQYRIKRQRELEGAGS